MPIRLDIWSDSLTLFHDKETSIFSVGVFGNNVFAQGGSFHFRKSGRKV